MAAAQEFGPRRSRAGSKPRQECPDIVVYRCGRCGRMCQGLGYDHPAEGHVCCGLPTKRLEPLWLNEVSPEISVDYQIVGGYNQGAVQVSWKVERSEDVPEWVLLKTFTGSYIKYVTAEKRLPVVFALADEDAYVYCDESTCLQCVFRCKRGFVLYLYVKTKGLLKVPLERMSAHWQS